MIDDGIRYGKQISGRLSCSNMWHADCTLNLKSDLAQTSRSLTR